MNYRKLKFKHLATIFICIVFLSCKKDIRKDVSAEEKFERPNIIFILADDMGYQVPGSYGGQKIATPHIDALARDGMRFTNAYAGNSVCAPSRASIMLGLHTGHTSLRGNTGGIAINDEDITLAEVLKKAGYTTGGFGKWGLGDIGTDGAPENQGFDEFFGYYHQIHAHFYHTDYLVKNGKKIETLNKVGDSASYTHYKIMKEMKGFITKNKNKPFFCFGSWTLPHTDDLGNPKIPETDPAYKLYQDKPWTEDEKKYAAMNTLVDYSLGDIRALVKELGIEKNTMIVFASDNGGGKEFDEQFDVSGKLRGFKHQFYEGGIKAVQVYYWDGKIKPGSVSDLPNYFADMMPTFAELTKAQPYLPDDLDGISIVPTLLDSGEQRQHDYLYWELPAFDWGKRVYQPEDLQQAIRVGHWKLLRHHTKKPWELYALEKDPGESLNVADQNPEVVKALLQKIEENRTSIPEQIEPDKPEGKWYR